MGLAFAADKFPEQAFEMRFSVKLFFFRNSVDQILILVTAGLYLLHCASENNMAAIQNNYFIRYFKGALQLMSPQQRSCQGVLQLDDQTTAQPQQQDQVRLTAHP